MAYRLYFPGVHCLETTKISGLLKLERNVLAHDLPYVLVLGKVVKQPPRTTRSKNINLM